MRQGFPTVYALKKKTSRKRTFQPSLSKFFLDTTRCSLFSYAYFTYSMKEFDNDTMFQEQSSSIVSS